MIIDLSVNSKLPPIIYDRLKKISFSKKENFNKIIGIYSELLSSNIDWLLTRSASRNTHQSQLYYYFCCILLIEELILEKEKIDKIIIDSKALKSILILLKKKHKYSYKVELSNLRNSIFKNNFTEIVKYFINNFRIKQFQFRAAKQTRFLSNYVRKSKLILIDIFILQNYVDKDRYYNGLWDNLNEDEKGRVFFVPTIVMMDKKDFKNTYKKLRNSDRNFLIKEDFLNFYDLFYSLFHLLRIFFIKFPKLKKHDINLLPLIKEEIKSNEGFNNTLEGLLNYRFAKNLKNNLYDLSLVIDWWEGQPLDKGWNLGFNTFFPNITTKGYLGYAPREMELQLFPTKSEYKNKLCPKIISTIGKNFTSELKSKYSINKSETAPAFRFSHLWEDYNRKSSTNFRIIIALSIMLDESIDILLKVINTQLVKKKNFEFIIKPHPAVKMDSLKKEIGKKWPNEFKEKNEPTPVIIRNSDLLITGMSSVGIEAIAMGTPVIVIETLSGLPYEPIPSSVPNSLWKTCRFSNELFEAINYFFLRSDDDIKKNKILGEKIKSEYFEIITKKGVKEFLQFKN